MTRKQLMIRFLIYFLIFGGIIAGVVVWIKRNQTYFNDDYVNGNTPGNLCNSGQFCEKNDTVYFANPEDAYHLYAMDSSGGNVRKLNNDVPSSINADAHYLYYVRNNLSGSGNTAYSFLHIATNSLVRCDLNGSNVVILDEAPCLNASLVGNYIYYIHYDKKEASTFWRVKIDGSDSEQLAKVPYVPSASSGAFVYYNGVESDHNIYRFDSETKTATCIFNGNYWMPQVLEDAIYTLDCEKNYALLKISLNGGENKTLTDDRLDCFNATDSYIYYQKNDATAPGLYAIRSDGSQKQLIASGNFTNINVTSHYLYFQTYSNATNGNRAEWFQMPIGGDASQVESFHCNTDTK